MAKAKSAGNSQKVSFGKKTTGKNLKDIAGRVDK
jgi:hypothetical protein